MTKYVVKHQWVKDLHFPKAMSQILDSAVDHTGRILDNTGPRDLVYLAAYGSAVFVAYNLVASANQQVKNLTEFWPRLQASLARLAVGESFFVSRNELDMDALLKAMIVAYMVLKVDASDIASAVAKVSSGLTSVVMA